MHVYFLVFLLSVFYSCPILQGSFFEERCFLPLRVDHRIKEISERFLRQNDVEGMAIAFCIDGCEFFFNFGINPVDKRHISSRTLFPMGSPSRFFTPTILALAAFRNKIALEDSIINNLPITGEGNLPIRNVTFLDLATHTSGLPRVFPRRREGCFAFNGEGAEFQSRRIEAEDSFINNLSITGEGNLPNQPLAPAGEGAFRDNEDEEVFEFLRNWCPTFPIGSRIAFSEFGFEIIESALSRIENKSCNSIIEDEIFAPLGMGFTSLEECPPWRRFFASGFFQDDEIDPKFKSNSRKVARNFFSTSRDMLNFLQANLGFRGPLHLIGAMRLAQQGFFPVRSNLVFGLGWRRFTTFNGLVFVDMKGGAPGVSSFYIGMIPEQGIGIVILATKSRIHIRRLGRRLLILLSTIERF